MVTVRIVVDGTEYSADVTGNQVNIDGRTYTVEDKGDTIEVDGTPYKVELKTGEVVVNGIPHTLAQEASTGALKEKKQPSSAGAVIAMMPGKVLNVLVKEGDSVQEGTVVCILEAMKMQNELRTPKSGTVRKVHVKAGANVDKGDPLVEIE